MSDACDTGNRSRDNRHGETEAGDGPTGGGDYATASHYFCWNIQYSHLF